MNPKRHHGAVALIDDRGELGFEELWALAGHMVKRIDECEPEGHVAFVAEPTREVVALLAGLVASGRLSVPLHPRSTASEREALLGRFQAPVRVVDPSGLALGAHPSEPPRFVAASPHDPAVCLFTSGTSGRSRGVLLSRKALEASVRAHCENLPLGPGDRWLCPMPLAHAGGLMIGIRTLLQGATVVLLPRFEPGLVLEAVSEHRPAFLSLVPTMLRRLLGHPEHARLASLRAILLGGAPLPTDLRKRARALGLAIKTTYGLTETASQIATLGAGRDLSASAVHVGAPLAGVEIELRDEDGAAVATGKPGRVFMRGPMLMSGYLGEPPLSPDAWLETRDIGLLDAQGELSVLGRADETILTGGENVHPAEVEAALLARAEVTDAVVFGAPDEEWGERVACALVLRPGAGDAERIVAQACRELSRYKIPRKVVVLERFAELASGKVDRARVRREAMG